MNLVKSDFRHPHVTYFGHVVSQGQVKPVTPKVVAIINYPAPSNKRDHELLRNVRLLQEIL